MNWWKGLKVKIRLKEPLENHTTFKIGGPCDYFIEPKDIADLKLLINLLKRDKIPFLIIGSGSNILVSDKGINVAVLHLSSPAFKHLSFRENLVEVGAGYSLSQLILAAKSHCLSGLEFLTVIPGTVGGALLMNAGEKEAGHSFGDLVESVTVMDNQARVQILEKPALKFGYRKSNLAKYIILGAKIKLFKSNKKEIQHKIKKYFYYRKNSQDLKHPSAGCIFRNPIGDSAGRLIAACGLKGKRVGGARVSPRHANFIINCNRASSDDVLRLMNLIINEVKKKFKVTLQPEIKIWQ